MYSNDRGPPLGEPSPPPPDQKNPQATTDTEQQTAKKTDQGSSNTAKNTSQDKPNVQQTTTDTSPLNAPTSEHTQTRGTLNMNQARVAENEPEKGKEETCQTDPNPTAVQQTGSMNLTLRQAPENEDPADATRTGRKAAA